MHALPVSGAWSVTHSLSLIGRPPMPPLRLSSFTAAFAPWRAGVVDDVASRFTNVTGIGGPDAGATFCVRSAAPAMHGTAIAIAPSAATAHQIARQLRRRRMGLPHLAAVGRPDRPP